ncbi:hypothetical protein Tco_0700527 [Tanacetum coccineum]
MMRESLKEDERLYEKVFQQCRSRAKSKLSKKCGKDTMGNEPILLCRKGAEGGFVLYNDARNKDWKHAWKKKRSGPKWAPCLARVRSNRVLADVGSLPRMFLGPRKVALVGLGAHYDNTVQAQRPGITRLRFRYSSPSTTSCASATLLYLGSITDIKYVLTQKNLDIFCQNFHIPDEVHPQLPSPNQTMHEMPTGKIGVYNSGVRAVTPFVIHNIKILKWLEQAPSLLVDFAFALSASFQAY